ncbi:MAG: hypothetical protein M3362_03550 [Acidobacteriota bacterium]|nr:hypothetical protein [Acidobacteriota bacterium]
MPKLSKNVLAQAFKFECDRYLRFRLAESGEFSKHGIDNAMYPEPGIELIQEAGHQWESDKYRDLISVAGAAVIEHNIQGGIDQAPREQQFDPTDLIKILKRRVPPLAIIEGEFAVPASFTPALEEICTKYRLELKTARPDIVWIRKARTGAPLIGPPRDTFKYELHIIDVKMAAEPSLKHFAEVTFYALALSKAIREHGLEHKYAVSAEGFIWPGNYDANWFRNLSNELRASGDADVVTSTLLRTLKAVPYEVYRVHVKNFFEEWLPQVLEQGLLETNWHVWPKCQICGYLRLCKKQAAEVDHLSRLPWLSKGQAEILRRNNIHTTAELAQAIEHNTPEWQSSVAASHQLRADVPAVSARVQALQTNQLQVVAGRKCATMPKSASMKIFLTVHSDPGSGITFSLGAKRKYFSPEAKTGERPLEEEHAFIVDSLTSQKLDRERARLLEFTNVVTRWLIEADEANKKIKAERIARGEKDTDFGKVTVHIYFWYAMEVKQLREMLERHMHHPDVTEVVELLLRMFPPESTMPDPDYYKSIPGTIVKDVIRQLVGLPIPHDYTLLETANAFYPWVRPDGSVRRYWVPDGFITPLNDQIPFHRAYELWEDRIYLRHDKQKGRKYTRGEIQSTMEKVTLTRLDALRHIVEALEQNHKDQLTLRKGPFVIAPKIKSKLPEETTSLIAFEKMNAVCQELDNRQKRALPVDERESRFISIRGLLLADGQSYKECIDRIKARESRYANRDLLPFVFASTSRDAKIKEGEFLLALSNEDDQLDLDTPLYRHFQLSKREAQNRLESYGVDDEWAATYKLSTFLQVEIVKLEAAQTPPFLVLCPAKPSLFTLAERLGIIDLGRPLVLDPIFRDFSSGRIERVMKVVGGTTSQKGKKKTDGTRN